MVFYRFFIFRELVHRLGKINAAVTYKTGLLSVRDEKTEAKLCLAKILQN